MTGCCGKPPRLVKRQTALPPLCGAVFVCYSRRMSDKPSTEAERAAKTLQFFTERESIADLRELDANPNMALAKHFRKNRWEAHQFLFAHRHRSPSADFHEAFVDDFWSRLRFSLILAYRGSAKSTLAEEDIILAAIYREFHNILIVGASEGRAAERVGAISFEMTMNPRLVGLYGKQQGSAWTQTKLVTTGQVCIQAIGRDQDIRGIKFLDYRPDFVLVDDFEDKDSVQTPEGRVKTLRWFLAELLPACDPQAKIRIRATPMDAESVPMRLMNESGWPTRIYPVEYPDPETGKRRAAWPEVHSLQWVDETRATYESVGELAVFNREYMCNAVADSDRVFSKEMIRVEPRERTWQAVYAMIDPARTVRNTSASTGWAVWSWIRNRLVVWGAGAPMILPDEIVALAFDIAERFDPVWVGVEQDGLEEFLLQPLRHEQSRRGVTIPLKGVRAPRGKLDFIKGLQPFFAAREVVFAQHLPELETQLLNFPTGRIDAPNALAYALQMRPASPIYDGFTEAHITDDLAPNPGAPLSLAANATGAVTTAILAQHSNGILRILADWVFEGPPSDRVADIAAAAALAVDAARWKPVHKPRVWDDQLKAGVPGRLLLTQRRPGWVAPPLHSDRYRNVGLLQAVRRIPAEVRVGGPEAQGGLYIRSAFARQVRGEPAIEISSAARWTLRALAGGYTRALIQGKLREAAEEGPYRVLMEGLEAYCGLLAGAREDDEDVDNRQPMRLDARTGARYASAMPERRPR